MESNKSKFGAPGSNNSSLFDASSPKNYDGVTMSNDRLTDYIRATNLKDRQTTMKLTRKDMSRLSMAGIF